MRCQVQRRPEALDESDRAALSIADPEELSRPDYTLEGEPRRWASVCLRVISAVDVVFDPR